MRPGAKSRELIVGVGIAILVGLAFVAVTLSAVTAREDASDLERSIQGAIEESAPDPGIPLPRCNQQKAGIYRCYILPSADDPAGTRAPYEVLLDEEGCWRLSVGDLGLSALGIRALAGCIAGYPD